MYQGGQTFENVKSSHDKKTTEETISKQQKKIDFLNGENHRLESEMKEIKELLGICESNDPTDKDRVHLKTLVRKLKQRND
jgi:cell shape-determining protein MreC